MTDILDEILSEDKYNKRIRAFRKVFPFIITLTVIIGMIIGGINWISVKKNEQNQKIGDDFAQILAGEYKDERSVVNLLENIKKDGESRISELAALKLVIDQVDKNRFSEALASLDSIIADKHNSEITLSYAKILYVSLVLDKEDKNVNYEKKSLEYLEDFDKDSKVFYGTATLLKSLFYLKNRQYEVAKKCSEDILKSPRTSGITKDQAKAVLEKLESEQKV